MGSHADKDSLYSDCISNRCRYMHLPVSTNSALSKMASPSVTSKDAAGPNLLASCDLNDPGFAKSTQDMYCSSQTTFKELGYQNATCFCVSRGSDLWEELFPDVLWEKHLLNLGNMERVHCLCTHANTHRFPDQ